MSIFPVSSLDPFADDFLAAPYPFYAELREAGPAVWLERYGLWACARHAEVQAALSDWQTFSSAAGVGIDDFRRTKPWRPPSLILEADPPLHTRSRTVMNRALSAKPIAGLRAGFKEAVEKLADELVARTDFVVLMSAEPQGGLAHRRRERQIEVRYDRLPYWRSPFGSPYSPWWR
jgi:4-methoxybenzoate monooxygenase (O-demethylating)